MVKNHQLSAQQTDGRIGKRSRVRRTKTKRRNTNNGRFNHHFATIIPVLLFTKFNIYVLLLIVSMLWMGAIGFIDDYLKKIKKNKDGLSGIFKIIGQVGLGLIVGVTMYFHPDITIKRKYADAHEINRTSVSQNFAPAERETISTVPFMKNNEFDYSKILFWMDEASQEEWAWIIFIPLVIFIVTAVSNGANITDGIDGLAAGTSVVILGTLAFFLLSIWKHHFR